MKKISQQARQYAQRLLDFIDDSPSPWHAVDTMAAMLQAQGFYKLDESAAWQLSPGQGYFVTRGDASLIAFRLGSDPFNKTGFCAIGAHTDSPGLRLKPRAAGAADGLLRLGVEVYGGPILATFTDRDLSLAGRINVRSGAGFDTQLVKFDRPLARLPNLAIHMNREVNEQGLKLHKQHELPLILSMAESLPSADAKFKQLIAHQLGVDATAILNWELNVFDTQKGSFWGADQEFVANSQLDNLASCHAALTALLESEAAAVTQMCAFFDHEEVGSESVTGAGGSMMADVIDRICHCLGLDASARLQAIRKSFFISADMAHGYHPNFPNAYEPGHHVMVNGGPVIKQNANQRYSTNAETAARFMLLCEQAGVEYQQYTHRTDLGCGSTIGPMLAAGLGVATVDVGCPMWAMHSIRESAGVLDHYAMITVMKQAFMD